MHKLAETQYQQDPRHFENHWAQTGSSKQIGDLVGKEQDPYVFPHLIEDIRTRETPKSIKKKKDSLSLLFCIILDISPLKRSVKIKKMCS